jgi:hypothetical protein
MNPEDSDPMLHVAAMRTRFGEMAEHLRRDLRKFEEPQAKAMFETAAEVLGGLDRAFADYAEGSEAAWTRKG